MQRKSIGSDCKMRSSLRNIERKSYAQPKHERGKKSDQKVGYAIIIDSGNKNSRNSRNLIIGRDLFKPQGKPSEDNAYYECKVKGCHARATISQLDLMNSISCEVKLKNEHSHAPGMESVLAKGGFHSDSDEKEEAGSDFVERSATSFVQESASAGTSVADESILEFVDVNKNSEQDDEGAFNYADESMQDFEFAIQQFRVEKPGSERRDTK